MGLQVEVVSCHGSLVSDAQTKRREPSDTQWVPHKAYAFETMQITAARNVWMEKHCFSIIGPVQQESQCLFISFPHLNDNMSRPLGFCI